MFSLTSLSNKGLIKGMKTSQNIAKESLGLNEEIPKGLKVYIKSNNVFNDLLNIRAAQIIKDQHLKNS